MRDSEQAHIDDEGKVRSEDLFGDLESIEGLDADERHRALVALEFLARELNGGPDMDPGHPLYSYLINRAAWTRRWLTWLGESLICLRQADGYTKLLARIRDRMKSREGLSVLRAAVRLHHVGFAVAFDRRLTTSQKVPDLTLTDPNRQDFELCAEVSALGESDESKRAEATSLGINEVLLFSRPPVSFCGRIEKSLSKTHLAEAAREVRAIVTAAQHAGEFRALVEPGVLAVGVSPRKADHLLVSWAREHGIEPNALEGPSYSSDEIRRLGGALKREQIQLPRDRAGLLILEARPGLELGRAPGAAAAQLEEYLFDLNHVLAAVVTTGYTGYAEPAAEHIADHAFVRQVSHGLVVEEHLILINRFCRYADDAVLKQLRRAYKAPTQASASSREPA